MVKSRYILVALFFICTEAISAQCYIVGEPKVLDTLISLEVCCELNLQKNKYYLLFTESYIEGVLILFASYGRVHKVGHTYYLKDIPSDAEIVLEANKDNSKLVVKKGFSFMKNEQVLYSGDAYEGLDIMVDIDAEYKKKKERDSSNNKKKNLTPVPLKLGVYENGYVTLSLEYDFYYQIHYNFHEYSPLISEGKWTKEGNVLKLHDSFLNHSFTALVDSGKITVIDFPNEHNPGCKYFPVEDKMLPFVVR